MGVLAGVVAVERVVVLGWGSGVVVVVEAVLVEVKVFQEEPAVEGSAVVAMEVEGLVVLRAVVKEFQ